MKRAAANIGGGFQQRLKRAHVSGSAQVPIEREQSQLAKVLLQHWAWGKLSTPMIQELAQAGQLDIEASCGMKNEHLEKIASIGCHGKYQGSLYRDLTTRLKKPIFKGTLFAMPMWIKISFFRTLQLAQMILLPHMLFAHMYAQGPKFFYDTLCDGHSDTIRAFWDAMSSTGRYKRSKVRARTNHRRLCVPVGFHGDGVTVLGVGKSWSKTCEAFSWSSMLSKGSTKFVNFLIYIIFNQCRCIGADKDSMKIFWKYLKWSFEAMWAGTWPSRDADGHPLDDPRAGQPLAGGHFAILWALKGDLDYFDNTLMLEGVGDLQPCIKCKANLSDIPWTEYHPTEAKWLHHCWQPDEWGPAHPNKPALFEVSGVDIDTVSLDVMHTKHLGTDQYSFASILHMLVHDVLGDSPDRNMQTIWGMIEQRYKKFGITNRYGEIRRSMYEASDALHFPRLKGRASEIRHLARPLLDIWEELMDKDNQQHRQVRLLLKAAWQIERILDEAKDEYVLPEAARKVFKTQCYQYVAAASCLGNHYHTMAPPRWLFHFTMKFHYLLHIATQASDICPRLTWCYQGEDLLQHLKVLIQASARGCSPQTLVNKIMERYIVGLSYAFMEDDEWL